MSTIHGLKIALRVPVGVINDDDIRCGQVNSETASSRGEHENELLTAVPIELVNGRLNQNCFKIKRNDQPDDLRDWFVHRGGSTATDATSSNPQEDREHETFVRK